jgi:hypothetical protein
VYVEFFKQSVKTFSVFRNVYALCGSAENGYSRFVQRACQFYGGLTAECNNNADGFFNADYVHHVFFAERLKIKPVRRVIVGRNRFGVVVYDNNVISHLFQRPNAVNGRVVKLDALTYAYRSRAENYDNGLSASAEFDSFARAVRNGIEIRRFRIKFRGAGVHHFI